MRLLIWIWMSPIIYVWDAQGLDKGTPRFMACIPLTLARCCSSCRISWAFCSTFSAPRRVSSRSMNTRYAVRICSEGRDAQGHPPLSCGTPVLSTTGTGCPLSASHAGCCSLSCCPQGTVVPLSPSHSPHPAPGRGSVRAGSAHPGQSGTRDGHWVSRGRALCWARHPSPSLYHRVALVSLEPRTAVCWSSPRNGQVTASVSLLLELLELRQAACNRLGVLGTEQAPAPWPDWHMGCLTACPMLPALSAPSLLPGVPHLPQSSPTAVLQPAW